MMNVEYDKSVDVAYVNLKRNIRFGEAKSTKRISKTLVFDYDKKKKLIGIEFLDARKQLPKEVLASAKRIDRKQKIKN